MKTEMVSVTPAMAREWLKSNTKNRPIRWSHVNTLRQMLERGEQVTTHQGIAFDAEGVLIDGQHRLTALSLMPDGTAWVMLVTSGLDRDMVFPAVDHTQAKRSISDVLGIDKTAGETASFMFRFYFAQSVSPSPVQVRPWVEFVAAETSELMAFCPTMVRLWSSSPVRAAAVLAMKDGHRDYAKHVYRAMVARDFEAMPPVAHLMFRAGTSGNVRASGAAAYDLFVRSLRMFIPKNAGLKVLKVVNEAKYVNEVRVRLWSDVYGSEKEKAPPVARAEAKKERTSGVDLIADAIATRAKE